MLKEVGGSVVVSDSEQDHSKTVTVLVVAAVLSFLLYGYRRFWQECRGDY